MISNIIIFAHTKDKSKFKWDGWFPDDEAKERKMKMNYCRLNAIIFGWQMQKLYVNNCQNERVKRFIFLLEKKSGYNLYNSLNRLFIGQKVKSTVYK